MRHHPVSHSPGARWTRLRRIAQATVAVFFLLLPLAHVFEWDYLAGTLVALKLGPVDVVEPASGTAAALAAGRLGLGLLVGMVPLVVLAMVLGPVFCSWICPWGLVSEGVDHLRKRRRWSPDGFLRIRWPRIAVLAGLLSAGVLLGSPLAALVAGPRLITVLPFELVALHALSTVTAGLLLVLLALELLGPRRLWCRALCPAGTLAKLLRTPRSLTVRVDAARCHCPRVPHCQTVCAWGIDPRRMGRFDGCTNCLACVERCPSGAITPAFGRGRPAPRPDAS